MDFKRDDLVWYHSPNGMKSPGVVYERKTRAGKPTNTYRVEVTWTDGEKTMLATENITARVSGEKA